MQKFVNNWSAPAVLAMGATSLPVALPDGTYLLTLSDNLTAATRWEIAEAVVVSGSATLTRGIEGTLEQDWPAGSVMYIGVTAGFLEGLQQQIAEQQAALTAQALQITDLSSRVAALEGGGTAGALTNASGDALTNATGQILTTGVAGMSEQHIYRGEGSPIDLGIHAPVGSHYIDTTRLEYVWVSTFHDPNPEEPYTEWVKLEQQWPPTVSPGGGLGMQLPFTGRDSAVMRYGGNISFSGEGVIFSNVEMTTNLDGRTYSSPDAFMFTAVGADDGSVIFTVSPLFEYIQGGAES